MSAGDTADPFGPGSDPFGTARLRAAICESWQSPTGLLGDSAAESDLVSVGYRYQLFTRLAANGADAAAAAGYQAPSRSG